jgi:hypothetical protein
MNCIKILNGYIFYLKNQIINETIVLFTHLLLINLLNLIDLINLILN